MKYFKKILSFQKLLKDFNLIYRDLHSIHSKHDPDNDVEHSFRVAMLCWMIADEYKLKLDSNKIVKYALIHDLVEVYAGDVSIYANVKHEDKAKAEHNSFMKLKKKFPNLKSIWRDLENYEDKKDQESKFVYIIEKWEPVLLILLSEDDHWIRRKVNFDKFVELKMKKMNNIDSFAQNFSKDIFNFLDKNKTKFFPSI